MIEETLLEAIDKMDKAMMDLFSKNPALDSAFEATTKRKGHRDYLLRLRYMENK